MGVKEVHVEVKKLLGIPDDEPIFILRAQDKLSVSTLCDYNDRLRDAYGYEGSGKVPEPVKKIVKAWEGFQDWQLANPGSVKRPD